jgi:hypothetical protein
MSSFTKEMPKGSLAVSILFISLFFVQVIVEIVLRLTVYENGQVEWAWSIGGSLILIGVINLVYNYVKFKRGGFNKPVVVEGEASTIALDIPDKKLFRGHLFISIFLFILSPLVIGISSSPFNDRTSRITGIVGGVILLAAAILNVSIYAKKPPKMRQKYLEKRAKKLAKKGY